jgi:DNA-binding transcriptional LysR family regulator
VENRWLQAFIAVAEELHFGRAATRIHMAQSPLSQTIRKLERELDATLFDRNTRRVTLTAAGVAVLPHAYKVLEELELAKQAAYASVGSVYGTVKIGFSGALNHRTLPPLTRAVRQRHPDIALKLMGRIMTAEGLEQLEKGGLDLAFVGLPLGPTELSFRLIDVEPLGAVLPIDHPLADEAVIDLADLANEGFISTPANPGSALQEAAMRACVGAGFRPRVVQEITDPYMMFALVSAGLGVALMASSVAEILPSGARFIPLTGEQSYMLHGIAWSGNNASPALRAVLDISEELLPTPDALSAMLADD